MGQKKYFITFGNQSYRQSLERIKKEALEIDFFDDIFAWNENNLDRSFWEKHNNFIISNKRGFGYWIWKPQIILQLLDNIEYNDIILYADAGCTLNKSGKDRLNEYIDMVNSSPFGNLGFELKYREKTYTKREVLCKMNYLNEKDIESKQLVGGIFIIRKCEFTINLVKKWHAISTNNYDMINDILTIDQHPEFIEHRHDQSVFSILRKQLGCVILEDEVDNINFKTHKHFPIHATRIRK